MAETSITEAKQENPKLAALLEKQAKINARIAELKAREQGKNRKEDTRLKVVVGAALLADARLHPEIRETVKTVLTRAVDAPRDVEFLKAKGWL